MTGVQTTEPPGREQEATIDPTTELPEPSDEIAGGSGESGGETEAEDRGTVSVESEVDRLKAERDRLLDRLARMQAEFENARRRAERDRAEDRDRVTGSVVEQFLPVVDNFALALKSTGSAHQLRSGVTLIVKQMEEVLQKLQVTPVAAQGEPFDPRVHEAMGAVERDDVPDQHVAEEIRRGYKIRERLLRPALVRVAHNAKQTSE